MLLTFNNILATYYASWPIHSLDNRYANIVREFLPPVALFYPKMRMSLTSLLILELLELLGREA